MENPNDLIPIVADDEIASVKDGRLRADDGRLNLNGCEVRGEFFAYRYSLERWRARQPSPSVADVHP
mgnify:CR=1 FL=1